MRAETLWDMVRGCRESLPPQLGHSARWIPVMRKKIAFQDVTSGSERSLEWGDETAWDGLIGACCISILAFSSLFAFLGANSP